MFEIEQDNVEITNENIANGDIIEENVREYIEVEMRTWKILYFTNPNNLKLLPDDDVIVEVDRGQDIGKVLHTCLSSKELDEQYNEGKIFSIIRPVTETDENNLLEINSREKLATEKFLEILEKYPFEMKLLDTIYQFDNNKLTFFFTAEGRIDFREFVRELAQIFKTRIELHQCTGRDEAKKLGGYGMCGNSFCCTTYMKRFSQVTIKMAKDQNLSGNLSKISGPCGRLLCCLHYEEDFYAELAKDFPEMGDELWIDNKKLYVFRNDLYAKVIYLTSDDQEIETITLDEYIDYINHKKKKNKSYTNPNNKYPRNQSKYNADDKQENKCPQNCKHNNGNQSDLPNKQE
ncbi:MAG: regulatory iron-sulfur-containing complex subunit RicT [Candidatus Cloacimonetes bacterium]|jgi:cell fate regulator YaaT (PSP1 superfamily)|nr:Tpl protein [Candidatus Cloacimonadota bacterium]MDD4155258.1 regulatory iron-sulfur-containing complex subunit RicT [Candidatus Cloacimonadota bacterium]